MNPSGPCRQQPHPPYPPISYYDPFPSSSTTSGTPNSSTSSHDFTPQTHFTPLPSTFLPSYYPENRNLDQWPSQTQTPLINSPTNHLLDGVALFSPPRQPPRNTALPTYDLTPEIIARSIGPAPDIPRHWGGTAGRAPWNELPIQSSRSTYSFEMSPSDSGGGGGGGGGDGGGGSGGGGGGGGVIGNTPYHPSTSPVMNPYPQTIYATSPPSGSVRPQTSPTDNGYRQDVTLPEPTPNSLGYPGTISGNVPIPFEPMPPSNPAGNQNDSIGGEEYAQALSMYEHLLEAIPHIRPLSSPAPSPGGQSLESLLQLSSEATTILSRGQSHPSDIQGNPYLNQIPSLDAPPPMAKRQSMSGGERKRERTTKCLGCGATETPEWRRGPMGPRTLCNACGLVHIKLQRKKRKAEEKAALQAAGKAKA